MNENETRSVSARWRAMSLWLAIGVLVAAALLGSVFIIAGDQAAIAGRAWLTLLIAAAFAGTVVLDASMGEGPNRWYLPVSISINAVLVLAGLLKIWGGLFQPKDTGDPAVWTTQLFLFLWIVVLLRAALIVTQTYGLRFVARGKTKPTRVFAAMAVVFVWVMAVLVALPSALPAAEWVDVWWRFLGAATLVTLVLFLIPVIVLAFEPRMPAPGHPGVQHPGVPHRTAPYMGGHEQGAGSGEVPQFGSAMPSPVPLGSPPSYPGAAQQGWSAPSIVPAPEPPPA